MLKKEKKILSCLDGSGRAGERLGERGKREEMRGKREKRRELVSCVTWILCPYLMVILISFDYFNGLIHYSN